MLKVSVKDFGPIIEGTIDLKPLTLFVGPSNAGKSYLAMLVYSLMQSSDASIIGPYVIPMRYVYFRPGIRGLEAAQALSDTIDEQDVKTINRWAQNIATNPPKALEDLFQEEPEISFASLPEELHRLVHRCVKTSLNSMEPLAECV